MILKILRERNRAVGTEIEIRNGIVDVIDIGNLIVYEIESNLTEDKKKKKLDRLKDVRDVFFIELRKIPDNFKDAEEYLREKVI